MELLEKSGPAITETGLKYVHNDTCYPAILVIGQFIDALKTGEYDPHKSALVLFQTGGGCRASNYIFLLKERRLNARATAIYPLFRLNLAGLENHPGFKLTLPMLHRLFYGIIYGDMLLSLVNQCKPYEKNKGQTESLADELTALLANKMQTEGISFKKVKQNCKMILSCFAEIPRVNEEKVKVGVVGEIYVNIPRSAIIIWSSF